MARVGKSSGCTVLMGGKTLSRKPPDLYNQGSHHHNNMSMKLWHLKTNFKNGKKKKLGFAKKKNNQHRHDQTS